MSLAWIGVLAGVVGAVIAALVAVYGHHRIRGFATFALILNLLGIAANIAVLVTR